jgi:hypothetical protein
MAKVNKSFSAADLSAMIDVRYSKLSWLVLRNVRNAGGFEADRAADAIAFGLWPSTGHVIHGFEIKISRADWLRELKDPWKGEAFAKFCDYWWIVAADPAIVHPGELRDGFGLMVPNRSSLKPICHAKERSDVTPVDRGLLSAILKRAAGASTEERNESFQRGVEQGKSQALSDYDHVKSRAELLEKRIKDFEEASGVRINEWRGAQKVGEAVKFVLSGGLDNQHRDLKRINDIAASIQASVASAAELSSCATTETSQ